MNCGHCALHNDISAHLGTEQNLVSGTQAKFIIWYMHVCKDNLYTNSTGSEFFQCTIGWA